MPRSILGKLEFANHSEILVLTQFVLLEISGKTAAGFSATGSVDLTPCAHASVVG